MKEILDIATTISPLGIIALLVIVIFQLLNGKGILTLIRGTQEKKYPEMEEHIKRFNTLDEKLELIATNHLHELPEMRQDIKEIKDAVNFIKDNHGNRLTRLETIINK